MITGAQILMLLQSGSFRPRVPVCFSCSKALYTSHTVTVGMLGVDFEVFDSKKRFRKLHSFDFDLSLSITMSATFAK